MDKKFTILVIMNVVLMVLCSALLFQGFFKDKEAATSGAAASAPLVQTDSPQPNSKEAEPKKSPKEIALARTQRIEGAAAEQAVSQSPAPVEFVSQEASFSEDRSESQEPLAPIGQAPISPEQSEHYQSQAADYKKRLELIASQNKSS